MVNEIRQRESSDVKKLRQLGEPKTGGGGDGGGASAGHPGAEGAGRQKLVRPKAKRTAARLLMARGGLSQRRVCRLVALDRNTLRYQSRRIRRARGSGRGCERSPRPSDATAARGSTCGCDGKGGSVNHKKVERIYREEGLSLRRRARKKATAVPRVALPLPSEPGRCYAMDFVHDRLANGRRFKCLTMTDLCSKEVPVIEVDVSIGGERVCRILDRLFMGRPWPETVILDNGPEFSGTALDAWAGQHGCG